jgi:hypothetical protein
LQAPPASLLSVFSEEDKDCAEPAGALERSEAGGEQLARQAEEGIWGEEEEEDVGEEGKARGPAVMRLFDMDLRGLEFSQEVAMH